ncbi:FkbM family methyltransferase [Myxococcota bacterium]|nr:FkbM family methyltransferase [Myxococcota bacterium]
MVDRQPQTPAPTSKWTSLEHTVDYYRHQHWRIILRDFPQVLYRRTGLPFYLASPSRLTHILLSRGLFKPIAARRDIEQLAQYALSFRDLGPESIVYSVGVGSNIYFDEVVADRARCKVHLFDPTPLALSTMRDVTREDLVFHPVAIWTKDGELELFFDRAESSDRKTASVTNQFQTQERVTFPCRTIASFMRELGHDHLDLLKMDIEGGALPVLEDLLHGPIRPKQIVMELERPVEGVKSLEYWGRLVRLAMLLKKSGYESYLISDKKGIAVEVVSLHGSAA